MKVVDLLHDAGSIVGGDGQLISDPLERLGDRCERPLAENVDSQYADQLAGARLQLAQELSGVVDGRTHALERASRGIQRGGRAVQELGPLVQRIGHRQSVRVDTLVQVAHGPQADQ
ncbi:MAG: hypothetical protein H0W81_10240 [Chloroflexi bacterium]|nr:hypothetical protein [Chloroflexota bacterium]